LHRQVKSEKEKDEILTFLLWTKTTALRRVPPLRMAMYRDPAETPTHLDMKERKSWDDFTKKLWWAPAVANSPRHGTSSPRTSWIARGRRDALALVHRSRGLRGPKHRAAHNDVFYQSVFSKPMRVPGASEKWLSSRYICRCLFPQPNLQTGTGSSEVCGIKSHGGMEFKKLSVVRMTLENKGGFGWGWGDPVSPIGSPVCDWLFSSAFFVKFKNLIFNLYLCFQVWPLSYMLWWYIA